MNASSPTPSEPPFEANPQRIGGVEPPADLSDLATRDAYFCTFWSPASGQALRAIETLFAPEGSEEPLLPTVESHLAAEFWRLLQKHQSALSSTPEERNQEVLQVLRLVILTLLLTPAKAFVEDYLTVALRPVRRLRAGSLTPILCTALCDYQRGLWHPHLTKSQLNTLLTALRKTLAALPPEQMHAFWEGLQNPDPMVHSAMLLGLELLSSTHSVPHLLNGLEQSKDHAIRSAIINRLEKIADPRALAPLMRLRRETAQTDWPLSRDIARAIRVIEHQNRNQSFRTLLRPAAASPESAHSLLRPAQDTAPNARRQQDRRDLLRPEEPEEEADPELQQRKNVP